DVLLAAVLAPWLALLVFTAFPLPCAVFAWKIAHGDPATASECLAGCWRRAGRLFGVMVRLGLLWLVSLMLLGIPLLWVWPQTCLVPLVALFEDERRIFRRSRRILREDIAVPLMGLLYLGLGLVLGGLVALPRLVLATPMLGAHLLEARWLTMILGRLW